MHSDTGFFPPTQTAAITGHDGEKIGAESGDDPTCSSVGSATWAPSWNAVHAVLFRILFST